MYNIYDELSPLESALTKWLFELLVDISKFSDENKMTPTNLGIVFGPGVFGSSSGFDPTSKMAAIAMLTSDSKTGQEIIEKCIARLLEHPEERPLKPEKPLKSFIISDSYSQVNDNAASSGQGLPQARGPVLLDFSGDSKMAQILAQRRRIAEGSNDNNDNNNEILLNNKDSSKKNNNNNNNNKKTQAPPNAHSVDAISRNKVPPRPTRKTSGPTGGASPSRVQSMMVPHGGLDLSHELKNKITSGRAGLKKIEINTQTQQTQPDSPNTDFRNKLRASETRSANTAVMRRFLPLPDHHQSKNSSNPDSESSTNDQSDQTTSNSNSIFKHPTRPAPPRPRPKSRIVTTKPLTLDKPAQENSFRQTSPASLRNITDKLQQQQQQQQQSLENEPLTQEELQQINDDTITPDTNNHINTTPPHVSDDNDNNDNDTDSSNSHSVRTSIPQNRRGKFPAAPPPSRPVVPNKPPQRQRPYSERPPPRSPISVDQSPTPLPQIPPIHEETTTTVNSIQTQSLPSDTSQSTSDNNAKSLKRTISVPRAPQLKLLSESRKPVELKQPAPSAKIDTPNTTSIPPHNHNEILSDPVILDEPASSSTKVNDDHQVVDTSVVVQEEIVIEPKQALPQIPISKPSPPRKLQSDVSRLDMLIAAADDISDDDGLDRLLNSMEADDNQQYLIEDDDDDDFYDELEDKLNNFDLSEEEKKEEPEPEPQPQLQPKPQPKPLPKIPSNPAPTPTTPKPKIPKKPSRFDNFDDSDPILELQEFVDSESTPLEKLLGLESPVRNQQIYSPTNSCNSSTVYDSLPALPPKPTQAPMPPKRSESLHVNQAKSRASSPPGSLNVKISPTFSSPPGVPNSSSASSQSGSSKIRSSANRKSIFRKKPGKKEEEEIQLDSSKRKSKFFKLGSGHKKDSTPTNSKADFERDSLTGALAQPNITWGKSKDAEEILAKLKQGGLV